MKKDDVDDDDDDENEDEMRILVPCMPGPRNGRQNKDEMIRKGYSMVSAPCYARHKKCRSTK